GTGSEANPFTEMILRPAGSMLLCFRPGTRDPIPGTRDMSDDPRTALPPNTPQALADLLEARRGQLLSYIERRLSTSLRRKIEPLDLFQETAVAALNAWPGLDVAGRDPFGWLCQIAEQRIIDASRHFAARKRAADREVSANVKPSEASRELIDLLTGSLTGASTVVARNERHAALNTTIDQLPAESCEVL